jgi:hypothetical protein
VVVVEDLAREFGLTAVATLQRIQDLLHDGTLTGICDDRGKFVYLAAVDLEQVRRSTFSPDRAIIHQQIALYLQRKGRVSLVEFAQECTRIVNVVVSDYAKTSSVTYEPLLLSYAARNHKVIG